MRCLTLSIVLWLSMHLYKMYYMPACNCAGQLIVAEVCDYQRKQNRL